MVADWGSEGTLKHELLHVYGIRQETTLVTDTTVVMVLETDIGVAILPGQLFLK